MRIVRDRGDARWLPSRFNFALFRLFAYVRLRSSRPQANRGLMLSVDRYQSAFENVAVCLLVVIVLAVDFAALWNPVVALPAAVIVLQAAIVLARLIVRVFVPPDAVTIRPGSMIVMAGVIGTSIYVALDESSAAYVARGFLLLVILNAIASAIMFLLRGRVAALEARFT